MEETKGEQGKFNPAEHFMKTRGQDYLPVKWRIMWFRQDHPQGYVHTAVMAHDRDQGAAEFMARVGYILPDGRDVYGTGHGSETKRDFADYYEKAETKAIGRALAMLGYGTQFAQDLDEGDRLADSPVDHQGTRGSLSILPGSDAQRGGARRSPAAAADAQADHEYAWLREQVEALLQDDQGALIKLPKPVAEMTRTELEKTRLWLINRAESRKVQAR